MYNEVRMKLKEDYGFSLLELLVVVGIVVTLLSIAGIQVRSMIVRYGVERQMRELHTDLQNARVRAMLRNRVHWVNLASNQYAVVEDTDPAPDGDGVYNDAKDTVVLQKNFTQNYGLVWNGNNPKEFNVRGMATTGTICSSSDISADYDCVIIAMTRINLGKLQTSIKAGGKCEAANCAPK